jgi:hypothetical protein
MPEPPRPTGEPSVGSVLTGVTFLSGNPLPLVVELWPSEVRWSMSGTLFARLTYVADEDGWLCRLYEKGGDVVHEFGGVSANGMADVHTVAINVGRLVAQLFTVTAGEKGKLKGYDTAIRSTPQPRYAYRFDGEVVERLPHAPGE